MIPTETIQEIIKDLRESFEEEGVNADPLEYLREAYLMNSMGEEYILLARGEKAPCLMYDMNGEFVGIQPISYAREECERCELL